jgi:hypothetical protein
MKPWSGINMIRSKNLVEKHSREKWEDGCRDHNCYSNTQEAAGVQPGQKLSKTSQQKKQGMNKSVIPATQEA